MLEIVGGSLVIGADQSWSETQEYRLTKNGSARLASVGSSGSWLFMRELGYMLFNDKVWNYEFSGTVAGGTVTLDLENGTSMVFSR